MESKTAGVVFAFSISTRNQGSIAIVEKEEMASFQNQQYCGLQYPFYSRRIIQIFTKGGSNLKGAILVAMKEACNLINVICPTHTVSLQKQQQ